MIYFDSRYLSHALDVNPAKWKRWAREFLPVDPLGGYQSGYARQFSYKDAFRVYFGGQLVAVLKFSIPEAREILSALDPWLKQHGFYAMPQARRQPSPGTEHIYIYNLPKGKLAFAVRTIVGHRKDDTGFYVDRYSLSTIGAQVDFLAETPIAYARVIRISQIHRTFLSAVARAK